MWCAKSERFPLTNNPQFDHLQPAWSSDDRYLVFQRSARQDVTLLPEVWLMDLRNGQSRAIAILGRRPAWLP